MLRRLILLRHAKSAWDDPTLQDTQRTLNARGRRDAPRMAAWLAAERIKPDQVLVSTAVRTRETWRLFEAALGSGLVAEFRDDLYHASAETIIAVVQQASVDARTLLVIGHNSGMEDAATALVGDGKEALRRAMAFKFPTCAMAIIEFDAVAWPDVNPGKGHLRFFTTPKSLG
jgi:phosphohistidine phosphatase